MDLIDRDGVGQAPDLDLPIARHDENPREPVLRPQMTDESRLSARGDVVKP
jgi:hypothetical protein